MPSNKKLLQAAAGSASSTLGYVEDVYSTYLYDGTDTTLVINNGIDLAGEGGLVWCKMRDNTLAYNHNLFDTNRGVRKFLESNTTDAEGTASAGHSLTTFNSNGFTLGTNWNNENRSSSTNVSWTFRKAEKFFDIVQWTGTQNASTVINHNVDGEVGMIIVKRTSGTGGWAVYHKSLGTGKYISLDQSYGSSTDAAFFPSVTSTNFRPGSDGDVNQSGITITAYVFASDAGGYGNAGDEDIIKCGTYTGAGANLNINVGFEPQFVLIKSSSNATNWVMFDTMRGLPVDGNAKDLRPNTTESEGDNPAIGITSTGFLARNGMDGQINANGYTYIYMAIRRPMKTPTAGTEVFAVDTRTTGAPNFTSGFPVDAALHRLITDGNNNRISARLTGTKFLETNTQDAEGSSTDFAFDYMEGWFKDSSTNTDAYSWMFKRAAGFFDVVCYTGNGVAGREISHGLTVAPEFMVVKTRDTADSWYTYDVYSGPTKFMNLDYPNASATASYVWNNTSPAASVFTVSNNNRVNAASGTTYIAYLFASVSGVSKVGTYTGTGADLNVDCGFTGGARFILIKKTNDQGDWFVYDSLRGISAGNDPYLLLNTTAAQVTGTDYIDPLNAGFTVTSSAPNGLNTNGGTYIFLAIA